MVGETLYNTADVLLGQLHKPSGESIPNAVMASKPGATFWLHVMREFVRRVNCHKPEFDTGPALITYVANSLGAAHRVEPRHVEQLAARAVGRFDLVLLDYMLPGGRA